MSGEGGTQGQRTGRRATPALPTVFLGPCSSGDSGEEWLAAVNQLTSLLRNETAGDTQPKEGTEGDGGSLTLTTDEASCLLADGAGPWHQALGLLCHTPPSGFPSFSLPSRSLTFYLLKEATTWTQEVLYIQFHLKNISG